MKRILALIILFYLVITVSRAQKYDISYGPLFGLNLSFMSSKASIDYNYPFHELDRDISLNKSNETGLGYQAGIFLKVQPVESRFSLEADIIIASYNNSHSLKFYREAYYYTPWTTPSDRWLPETEIEKIQNELVVLNIPIALGYDFIDREKYKLTLLGGLSTFIIMKDANIVKIDMDYNEYHLYKDFFVSYNAGIRADFGKIICTLLYDRTLNMQQVESRDYFAWQMKVEKLYLNSINFTVGYKLN
ncbi:MAG: hypothetical protein R6V23_01190 [Bacteroidales bacterium]